MAEHKVSYPPSINHYWRRVGDRTLISRTGREYRERVAAELAEQGVEMFDGRLGLFIRAFPPDRRRRDLDNILKALLDALEHGGLFYDDSQIDHLEILRDDVKPGGQVHLVLMVRFGK